VVHLDGHAAQNLYWDTDEVITLSPDVAKLERHTMNVLVTGATGFIGKPLCRALTAGGHTITAVVRDATRATRSLPADTRLIVWSPGRLHEELTAAVSEADALINLAGESIGGKRWTPAYKEVLRSSRIETTRALAEALRHSDSHDGVFLSGSAVGYYGDRRDEAVTEESGPGHDFLARLCVEWEAEARKAGEVGVRVVLLRTGIVLGRGGSLEQMMKPFRFGLGGPLGSGRQWVSWVHIEDTIRMILWALENPAVQGPLNVAAPNPVTNRELARTLGRVMGRPAFLPAPAFALRLVLGEFANAVLTGQKALPEKAGKLGFEWKHPTLEPALRTVLGRPA
jgi:uncharacterized protein